MSLRRPLLIAGLFTAFMSPSHAGSVASTQLTLSDLRFDIASIDVNATSEPAYAISGQPTQAYFFDAVQPSVSATWPASSLDGTRQVQGGAQGWTMNLSVNGEQFVGLWNTVSWENSPWHSMGTQVSVSRPSEALWFDFGGVEPQLVTLAPRSVLTISVRVEVHNQVDAQAVAALLAPYNTDQVRPYLMLGSRVSVESMLWSDQPTEEEVAALGEPLPEWFSIDEHSGAYLGYGFDATGQMTPPLEGYDIAPEYQVFRATIVNPFGRELTYRLNLVSHQELSLLEGEVLTTAVPEPSTYALMGLGLVGVAAVTRRRHAHA